MASFDFVIPVQTEDLLTSDSVGQYTVQDIYSAAEIPNKLQDWESELKQDGAGFILQNFDVLYGVIRHLGDLEDEVREDAWSLALKGCHSLSTELSISLDQEGTVEESTENENLLNAVKMWVYILCQLIEGLENVGVKQSLDASLTQPAKGRKKTVKRAEYSSLNWERERERGFAALLNICQFPLARLWNPPILEEEFVNLVTNCCYKVLESQAASKDKQARDHMNQIVGVMVKKHNHRMSCCLKVIQLLQHFEHVVAPVAQLMEVIVNQHGVGTIVMDVLREVGHIDSKELSKDTAGSRAIAAFLVEMTQLIPGSIMSSISLLLPMLDGEAYAMRNCVLNVICELVVNVLSKNDLEEREKTLRDDLLDQLEEHLHDVHAHVRSKALQIWLKLYQEKVVPLPRQHQLLDLVIGRLMDKSSNVRKASIHLLSTCVQGNPFAAKLSLEELQENCETEQAKLAEMASTSMNGDASVVERSATNGEDGDLEQVVRTQLEKETEGTIPATDTQQAQVNEVSKQQILVQYLQDSVKFVTLLQKAIPVLCQFLGSKQISDVLETIQFFVVAHEFGLQHSIVAVRRMLPLVWSKEQGVKDAVVNAYRRLYLDCHQGNNPRLKWLAVVKNLSLLLTGATVGELLSLEELMSEFVKAKEIGTPAFTVMWERFTMKIPDTSSEESQAALKLITMCAGGEMDLIRSNMDVLLSVGLGPRAEENFRLARDSCLAFLKLAPGKPKPDSKVEPYRLAQTHELFTRLGDLLVQGISLNKDTYWVPFMNQAVLVIYKLAEHPDVICEDVALRMVALLENGDQLLYARFFAFIGQVALSQMIHLDVYVFTELKRRQLVEEEYRDAKRKEKNKEKNKDKNKRRSLCASASATPMVAKGDGDKDLADEEMGLMGATADDAEAEFIRMTCEKHLVTGLGFLSKFSPLMIEVCSNPGKFPDPTLQAAATVALSKYMLVSSAFCEEQLQLLFTITDRSSEAVIRANCVIALGDLAFRFPNLIAPWTSYLYGRLRDDNVTVKLSAVTVLTHLILNDMIKVKGQISDMAVCMTDPNPQIAAKAKLLFHELGMKNNAIYNIMPDIISRLSDPEIGLDEDNFQIIMKYLFSLIQKDRQLESLIEKLCHRFRAARTDRQFRDLAFCLSLLSYSDRCLRKLQENIACYADKLGEPKVFEHFQVILASAKKSIKTDNKAVFEEFEQKLQEFHEKGVEDLGALNRAGQAKPKNTPAPKKRKTGPAKSARRRGRRDDDDSEEDEDDEEFVQTQKNKKKKDKAAALARLNLSDSDDDEDADGSDNEDDVTRKKTRTPKSSSARPTRARRAR